MSLLGKAEELQTDSSSRTHPIEKAGGLLSRAEDFLVDSTVKSSTDTPFVGLLKKAEKLKEDETKLANESLVHDIDVNEFDVWEDEARESSERTPIQPSSKDTVKENEEFLFDDESDFTTAPIEYHLASKKKIENYKAIFEITKEIASASTYDQFFANLNYSIIGQVGSETMAIFSSVTGNFERLDLLEYSGFQPTSDWSFTKADEIYNKVKSSESVMYAGELLSGNIPTSEKKILEAMNAEIIAPIRFMDQFYGFIALGPLINGEEYITDDLEFIKILADIAGSVFDRVGEFEERAAQIERINEKLDANNSVMAVAREMAAFRKLDVAYDLLVKVMKERFKVSLFTFLIFDPIRKDEYKIFSSNQLTPATIDSFRLKRNSDLVGMVSNVNGIYTVDNFANDSELLSLIPNDEIGIIEQFTMIPMINLNWLVGIFIIHKLEEPWNPLTKETVLGLFELIAPVFANILILDEKDNSFRNPFSPIDERLTSEIQKANSLNTSFTVAVFKVQNYPRMIQILGDSYFAVYCDMLRKSILEHLGENDHYVRVGPGKFVAIFHSKDKEESDILVRKIKNHFKPPEENAKTQFKASYRILTLEYPRDSKMKEQFMEMIEEA
ncbi:GAF domain-containing protein [Leptospira sp. GIMC2001]|uniref:GAF domain-containing protein n=1 Tax=Leptospira sp. GIMC2001 TaxID=1513297 RepID=UPI00234A85E1|nr:GAF domain-containing protein [Leptospira sp. GIMC2001]WCL48921.1 GAF domain-containing protein [Leptospira sp. GIMC2001]